MPMRTDSADWGNIAFVYFHLSGVWLIFLSRETLEEESVNHSHKNKQQTKQVKGQRREIHSKKTRQTWRRAGVVGVTAGVDFCFCIVFHPEANRTPTSHRGSSVISSTERMVTLHSLCPGGTQGRSNNKSEKDKKWYIGCLVIQTLHLPSELNSTESPCWYL